MNDIADIALPLLLVFGCLVAVAVWMIRKLMRLQAQADDLSSRLDLTDREGRKVNQMTGRIEDLSARLEVLERQSKRPEEILREPGATPEAVRPTAPQPPTSAAIAPAEQPKVTPVRPLSPLTPPTAVPELKPLVEPLKLPPPPVIQPVQVQLRPETQAARPIITPPREPAPAINWEQFMGVKMFAWLGGLALFLAVAFFVKYSFDNNLIPPEVRVALGFLTGAGLLVGGVVMRRKEYAVTAHTLCATGTVILYAVTFACRSVYHFEFFGPLPTFLLMVLITATAFLLAVNLDAKVVAVLGMLGGFLTPVVVSTGQDNPLGLFSYIALLDLGLMAVTFRRRWHFLILLAAVGTVMMQIGWAAKFFTVEKVFVAMAVFLSFNVLFLLGFWVGERIKQSNPWLSATAIGLPFVTLGFVLLYLLSFNELGARPGVVFSFVLGADLCLLTIVVLRSQLSSAHLAAGTAVFIILVAWTGRYLTDELLNWGLGLYFLFALLHSIFPVVLQRLRPGAARVWWGHLFPPLALALVFIPLLKSVTVSWVLWPCVLLIDLLAIGLAVLTASLVSIVAVLVLTLSITAVWLLKIPAEVTGLPGMLTVIGGFAVFFFVVGVFATRKIADRLGNKTWLEGSPFQLPGLPAEWQPQIPALSAILPFLLLIMVTARLPLANPSPVFGLALLLVVLLLGLAQTSGLDILVAIGFGCVLGLEHVWHGRHFSPDNAGLSLGWSLLFSAVFLGYPFLLRRAVPERIIPWIVAALAEPLHFLLIHRSLLQAVPTPYPGLWPAMLAVPPLLGLAYLARNIPSTQPTRNVLLAWFGGSALFFITLVFPIQFERQWLTIGWALEGVALLWLFHRVPQPGLRLVGVVMLAIAFARLALNPAVLRYHELSSTKILNWYLYSYGVVIVCLLAGARLLAPPRHRVMNTNVPPLLYGLGTALAFLLLNIEIADYFSTGDTLTFEFSGNFARDMTYTIAWALFALGLLVIGFSRKVRAARYAGVCLLGVTLLKLFFHDLAQLAQLYRIGALIAVAVIAILASFLYQRFLAADVRKENSGQP